MKKNLKKKKANVFHCEQTGITKKAKLYLEEKWQQMEIWTFWRK